MTTFTPSSDIPDLSSKVLIVTGGNAGIGQQIVKELAQHNPTRIYLAARSKAKYEKAVEELSKDGIPTEKIKFLLLDLASLASVSNAANQIVNENDRLDILINNAGIMGALPGLTEDGYEVHFGANYIGHAYLVQKLTPLLLKTAALPSSDVRIVNISSAAESIIGGKEPFDLELQKTELSKNHSYVRYGRSKLAQILFTRKLAIMYPSIKSIAVHPGRVRTTLLDGMFSRGISFTKIFQVCWDYFNMTGIDAGVKNPLWAAVSPQVKTGTYYTPIAKTGEESKLSHSMHFADNLWDWQEKEFKAFEARQSKNT